MSGNKRMTTSRPREAAALSPRRMEVVEKARAEARAKGAGKRERLGLPPVKPRAPRLTPEARAAAKEAREGLKALRVLRSAGTRARRPAKVINQALKRAEPDALDQEAVRELIFKHDGNISAVALALDCDPARLRAYVAAMPNLKRAVAETIEVGADLAVATMFEALRDKENFQNRFYAAKEFLRSETGRRRGFGRMDVGRPSIEVKTGSGTQTPGVISLRWIEPPKDEDGEET